MKSKNELHAIERDLYQLFDMVWAKFYAQIKNKPLFDKTEVDLTEAESFVLDKGPKWLQNIGYYRDLVGSQQQDEPDPGYLAAKIQEIENSVKELDERLKTAEEITERLLREDNDRIIGSVKRYEPGMPQRVIFERMKQDLREWIEKNDIRLIQTYFYTEPDGQKGVEFKDVNAMKKLTTRDDISLTIMGWPTVGLVDGWTYTPEELLITGEAGEE